MNMRRPDRHVVDIVVDVQFGSLIYVGNLGHRLNQDSFSRALARAARIGARLHQERGDGFAPEMNDGAAMNERVGLEVDRRIVYLDVSGRDGKL